MFGGITEAVEAGVVEAPDTTDTVVGAVDTDTEDTRDTGAVGGAGLALTAWWQAARWRFFSLSPGPR